MPFRREEPREKRPAPRLMWSLLSKLWRRKFLWLLLGIVILAVFLSFLLLRGPGLDPETQIERQKQSEARKEERSKTDARRRYDRERVAEVLAKLGDPVTVGETEPTLQALQERMQRALERRKKVYGEEFDRLLAELASSTNPVEHVRLMVISYAEEKKRRELNPYKWQIEDFMSQGAKSEADALQRWREFWAKDAETKGRTLRGLVVNERNHDMVLTGLRQAVERMEVDSAGLERALTKYFENHGSRR